MLQIYCPIIFVCCLKLHIDIKTTQWGQTVLFTIKTYLRVQFLYIAKLNLLSCIWVGHIYPSLYSYV